MLFLQRFGLGLVCDVLALDLDAIVILEEILIVEKILALTIDASGCILLVQLVCENRESGDACDCGRNGNDDLAYVGLFGLFTDIKHGDHSFVEIQNSITTIVYHIRAKMQQKNENFFGNFAEKNGLCSDGHLDFGEKI